MKNDGAGVYVNELKRGLTYVNKVFQSVPAVPTLFLSVGTPQTSMNTRFSLYCSRCSYILYKRVYSNK